MTNENPFDAELTLRRFMTGTGALSGHAASTASFGAGSLIPLPGTPQAPTSVQAGITNNKRLLGQ